MRNDATETLVIGVGGAGESIVERWARSHADTDARVRLCLGMVSPSLMDRAAGVFVVVGLGGRTGGPRAILEVTRAKARGTTTTVLAIQPFTFEGRGRRQSAQTSLAALREAADALHVFNNDDLLGDGDEALDLQGAYQKCDEKMWCYILDSRT